MGSLLREKLSDAVLEGIDAVHDMDVTHDAYAWSAADAIIAALPDMVKPLEWARHPIGWNCTGFMIDARNTKAIYVMRGLYGKPRFDTVEEAKAACNAHHVAQVLSAFGIEGDG